MKTFRWCVAPNISEKAEPRVTTIKFGDGYEQRSPDGINNDLRTYSVTFRLLNDEAKRVDEFLTEHNGYKAFLWKNPVSNKTITVKCASWSSSKTNKVTTITATFEQVIA